MWHHSFVIGQKPSNQEGSMGWRTVMVEQPCVVQPLIRPVSYPIITKQ
jgi:hypothetical protein